MLGAIPLLLLTLCVYQAGTGILAALVPVRLAQEGFNASVVGLVSTGFSLGFLAGCLSAPTVIAALNPRYVIAIFASANALVAIGMWLAESHPLFWAIARGIAGFGTATLFVQFEAWLAAETSPGNRGTVLSIYMLINRLVFMAGQITLAFTDTRNGALFLVPAVAYLLGALPSLRIPGAPPRIPAGERPSLLELPRLAPAAAAASLVHGLVTTAGPALFPIYGLAQGRTVGEIAFALAAIQCGGMLLQLPLGVISDHFERRAVMAVMACATGLFSLPFLFSADFSLPVLLLMVALWGGAPAVIYSLAAAHANDLAGDSRRIAWTSSLLLIWGIGAAAGPLAASLMMDWLGPRALFGFSAAIGFAGTLFLLWRRRVRLPKPGR
jgi:MFS family permease